MAAVLDVVDPTRHILDSDSGFNPVMGRRHFSLCGKESTKEPVSFFATGPKGVTCAECARLNDIALREMVDGLG